MSICLRRIQLRGEKGYWDESSPTRSCVDRRCTDDLCDCTRFRDCSSPSSARAGAATSTKFYDATGVAPTTVAAGTTSASLTLKLTNDSTSTQTLGSANFAGCPPAWSRNVAVLREHSERAIGRAVKSWRRSRTASNTVEFRANSSSQALNPGHSVSASGQRRCPVHRLPARRRGRRRPSKSNTFNGPPGNEVTRLGPTTPPWDRGRRAADRSAASPSTQVPGTQAIATSTLHRHSHRKGMLLRNFTLTTYGGGARRSLARGTLAGGALGTARSGPWSSGVASVASVSASASQDQAQS